MLFLIVVAIVSFFVSLVSGKVLIRKFTEAGLVGFDVHKPGKVKVPEMGGLAIVSGFVASTIFAVGLNTLAARGILSINLNLDLISVFATLATILIVAIIGLFDDLVKMRQLTKGILPVFASVPLIAVAAGHPYMILPFIGEIYLPLLYPLVLIPLGLTTASNLSNMYAGFNGMEAGMGLIMCLTAFILALNLGSVEAALFMAAMIGALLAFMYYNRHPSKVFPGDVGTLTIGASIACAVIVGNMEIIGLFLFFPHLIDFILKAKNGFPKEIDYTSYKNGKLYTKKVVGLPSLVLRLTGGLKECRLVASLLLFEALLGILTLSLLLRF